MDTYQTQDQYIRGDIISTSPDEFAFQGNFKLIARDGVYIWVRRSKYDSDVYLIQGIFESEEEFVGWFFGH